MLDYIKQELAKRAAAMPVQESTDVDPAEVSNELLMEFAPVMQGLDDLSIAGDGTDNIERPVIAIPVAAEDEEIGSIDPKEIVANDPELNSIELDPTSGTLKDIPMDANIQAEYALMKTKDQFIAEAYEEIDPTGNMTAEQYDAVVMESAQSKFLEYRNEVLSSRSFGFDKKNLLDESVVGNIFVEFAENKSAILEPNYQVDTYGNIRNKQIESIDIMNKYGHFQRLTSFMEQMVQEQYGEFEGSVWNLLQPVSMNVPIDPIDKHSVILGFKNMMNLGKVDYVRCSTPVMESNIMPEICSVSPATVFKMNKVSSTKAFAIQECQTENAEFLNIIQEAIDFGNNNPAPEANATPEAAPAPTVDAGAAPTDGAPAMPDAAPAATPDATPAANDGPTDIPVATNNVSDQIAEKVAADTEIPANSQNGDETIADAEQAGAIADDIPENPEGATDPALDAGATDMGAMPEDTSVGVADNDPALDAGATGDVESQLNELDAMGDTTTAADDGNMGMDAAGAVDVNNMSMDEMIQAATEKVKGMPIGILQKFLSGDTSALQESFVQEMVTSKNVNAKLDENLRACLGTLNDDELSFKGIENKFKKDGKKLNSVLSKAAKNSKVYDESERKELTDLNSKLTDLMVHFKPSKPEALEEAKQRIKAFTAQSKVVSKIITKHNGEAAATEKEEK